MAKRTPTRLREIVNLESLDRRLTREWDLGADPQRALVTAKQISDHLQLRISEVDLDSDFQIVSHGAEVLWDSKAFEDAEELVSRWRSLVTAVCEKRGVDGTEPQIYAAILSARLKHRQRDFHAATSYAHFAICQIQVLAGGAEALRDLLTLGLINPISEMCCAALAIAIPAGRLQFAHNPTLRSQLLERWVDDALLILDRDMPPRFRRIHALVSQVNFAIAERPGTPERRIWLDRLERFDDLVRPRHLRGQATKRLRDVARAQFEGDLPRELEVAEKALADLCFLPRHVEALTANRWWPLRAVS